MNFFAMNGSLTMGKKGVLRITYTDKTGDAGDGYNGSIEEAVINADRYDG